jgi:hypothetical protein
MSLLSYSLEFVKVLILEIRNFVLAEICRIYVIGIKKMKCKINWSKREQIEGNWDGRIRKLWGRFKAQKNLFTKWVVPWNPWDGMGRLPNPMGWEILFWQSDRMGWDKPVCPMGQTSLSHGTIFSSHPIPFGALVAIVLFNILSSFLFVVHDI